MNILAITNGLNAANLLQEAGMATAILPWEDVLHDGPVPLTADLEGLSKVRAEYLSGLGGIGSSDIHARFAARDGVFRRHGEFDEVVLWFEHDLYDQLQLIQLLDLLSGPMGRPGGLFLVQTSDYIGNSTPENVGAWNERRQAVDLEQRALARAAWTAYRQDTPRGWAALLDADTAALPFLSPSVERSLQDLPAPDTGLTRTQAQILLAVSKGADTPHILFRVVQHMEEAVFMGDLSFWRCIDALAFCAAPLLAGIRAGGISAAQTPEEMRAYLTAPVALTEQGSAVLAGEMDHAVENKVDMWLGGTHVTADNLWRWDTKGRHLVPPA